MYYRKMTDTVNTFRKKTKNIEKILGIEAFFRNADCHNRQKNHMRLCKRYEKKTKIYIWLIF